MTGSSSPIIPTPATIPPGSEEPELGRKVRRAIFGGPKNWRDRRLFHSIALIPFLAWVGLGADGLSSAAYGPAEAFLALGEHKYLALAMAIATPLTVLIIAAAYGRIIDAFPQGGGGYVVATKLLGPAPGVTSGCALVVDYVLTITVSIAAAGDAIFSLLPPEWSPWKLPVGVALILLGIAANIRGVKESVLPLVPIFLLFLITHAMLIAVGIVREMPHAGATAAELADGFKGGAATLGLWGMFLLFIRAYSLGAGTYTGIEAVSNGLNIMREPRVQTGKRTMTYMAISLAVTAGGLILCFLLAGVAFDPNRTLNAVLAEHVASGIPGGRAFVWALLISEAAILIVAAQTGFIGGPRVLANMALDGWVPRRFSALSERLTSQNGILLMGLAAIIALLYTEGHVHTLVIMYSINVFITFTLSMAAMLRATAGPRPSFPRRRRDFLLFGVGLVLCLIILLGTSIVKFREGGWVTLLVTSLLVGGCFLIRREYRQVGKRVAKLQRDLRLPDTIQATHVPPFDPGKPIAAVLVGGYSGLGVHTLLQAMSSFGGYFKNALFITVGVVDSGAFKGEAELEALRRDTDASVQRYVELAHRMGLPAQARSAIGLDPVTDLENLCVQIAREFPKVTFFAGQLIFEREQWHHRLLHNQTAYALQKRLQWDGIPMLILPVRVK
jgi:amino acid transporter